MTVRQIKSGRVSSSVAPIRNMKLPLPNGFLQLVRKTGVKRTLGGGFGDIAGIVNIQFEGDA